MRIIVSPEEAAASIRQFQSEIMASTGLQERLGYARSWYILKVDENYLYAPSKWVGYAGMTADAYVSSSREMDGRKTEFALKAWFEAIPRDTAAHNDHLRNLGEFMSQFGKTPSTETRFSILAVAVDPVQAGDDPAERLIELLIAVALTLPMEARARLRKRLS
jgi:hypothetical protein